jgi:hypothetical protein
MQEMADAQNQGGFNCGWGDDSAVILASPLPRRPPPCDDLTFSPNLEAGVKNTI